MKNKKIKDNDFSVEESPTKSKETAISATKKHTDFKHIIKQIKRVISFGKPFHGYLYLSLFGVFLGTFFDLLVPVYLGKSIDCLVGVSQVDFNALLNNVLFLILWVWLGSIMNFIANFFSNKYCFLSSGRMRKLIFDKFNSVPLKFIDGTQHGDLLSRMINDVNLLTDGYLEGLSSITNGIITIIGTLIFMMILNVPLALVVLFVTPLSLFICAYIAKKSFKLFAEQAKTEGEINGFLEEYISGARLITAFNYEEAILKKDPDNDLYKIIYTFFLII